MEENNKTIIKKLQSKEEVSELFDRLFPICRSILGEGYRQSLDILKEYMPMEEIHFLSGEKILNWTVPKEWVIREAWIKDESGNIIVDFKENNLHVVNYSDKIDCVLELSELRKHIFTSNKNENAIPYVTAYYSKKWGFCMSKKQLNALAEGKYHVYIDSEFVDGKLVVGEVVLKGESEKEILLSSYLCHPSMANNELSGPLVLAMLYQRICNWKKRKYTYRFVINPETIGSIAYLSKREEELREKMSSGAVLTCLGGDETVIYKQSRSEKSSLDKMMRILYCENNENYTWWQYFPNGGSDERQYCSVGFDLPVGSFYRKMYGQYKEYHTSLDTKELMGIENIIDSCDKIETVLLRTENEENPMVNIELENSLLKIEERFPLYFKWRENGITPGKWFYKNLQPYGEIKLSDYDLYPDMNIDGYRKSDVDMTMKEPWYLECVMMILGYSDGKFSLEYCAERLQRDVEDVKKVADILVSKGLLEQVPIPN